MLYRKEFELAGYKCKVHTKELFSIENHMNRIRRVSRPLNIIVCFYPIKE